MDIYKRRTPIILLLLLFCFYQGCDLSAAQGSSLTVFVNRVNSLREFEGGGGGEG